MLAIRNEKVELASYPDIGLGKPVLIHLFGKAEIAKFDHVVVVEEDIFGFDIAMNNLSVWWRCRDG